jgi:hypothetical protein
MGIASKDRCSTDVLQKDIPKFFGNFRKLNRNIQKKIFIGREFFCPPKT